MKVYLEARIPGWKLHSLYDSMINYPPEGVSFVGDKVTQQSMNGSMMRGIDRYVSTVKELKTVLSLVKPSLYYAYYKIHRGRTNQDVDLIYSSQHLIFDDFPWVVDLESVAALIGYGRLGGFRGIIETALASDSCKRIIPWTDAGKETLFRNLNCKGFDDKIETVNLAVPPRHFVREKSDDMIRMLFVGTGNSFNVRGSFEMKGGREIAMAFKKLRKKYGNLELTIRCWAPSVYVQNCRNEGIRIIPQLISSAQLAKEFEQADIFVYPGHTTPGVVLLDAMSYELPVVATDIWANREMISDGRTGLLTKPSRYAEYDGGSVMAGWGEPSYMSIQRIDPEMVEDLVTKLSYLIENPDLRHAMGRNGRTEIEDGKYSLKERNRKLGRIFRESLGS